MRKGHESDFQIDRAPISNDYLHMHYHPTLPDELRIWINGEKIRLTLAEVRMMREFLNMLLSSTRRKEELAECRLML